MSWNLEAEVQFIKGIGTHSGRDRSPAEKVRKLKGYIEGLKLRFFAFDSRGTPLVDRDRKVMLDVANRQIKNAEEVIRRQSAQAQRPSTLDSEASSVTYPSPQTQNTNPVEDVEAVETGPVSTEPPTRH